MDCELNYDEIIKSVNKFIKSNYTARLSNNKPVKSVTNFGAKYGDIVKLERNGEYYGISVQIMENVLPLLTDRLVSKILVLLKQQDFITAMGILNLIHVDQLFYILDVWIKNGTTCGIDYFGTCYKKSYPEFDQWITTVSHDPLMCKIKIVDVGCNKNTGGSVVPPEWAGKVYNSGVDMHSDMNKLEWRLGKPPVTYAIIYSMIVQEVQTIMTSLENIKYNKIIYFICEKNMITTKISEKFVDGYQFIKYNNNVIGFKLNNFMQIKTPDDTKREVGVLVSRLQKSVRRGRYGYNILVDTIKKLNNSPNYNLPEHGFMRVSSSRQLVWRLFITILEDCRPYKHNRELSLLQLIVLVLITQKCTEYKFSKNMLDAIIFTACVVQYNDLNTDTTNFKKLDQVEKVKFDDKSELKTSLFLALNNVAMMSGDKIMLQKYYGYSNKLEKLVVPKSWINYKTSNLFTTDSDIKKQSTTLKDIMLASYDHHCKPCIILYYQACIEVSMTTREISSYIWNISSSFNVRFNKSLKRDSVLIKIQEYFAGDTNQSRCKVIEKNYCSKKQTITTNTKRTSFLLLFGKKYRVSGIDVIISGSTDYPLKIKKNGEWISSNKIDYLNKFGSQQITLSEIDPPYGFAWTKNKVIASIKNGIPFIDNIETVFFDGSIILKSNSIVCDVNHKSSVSLLIQEILSGNAIDFDTLHYLRNNSQTQIRNWNIDLNYKYLNNDLIKLSYTKIFNQYENNITIGPVERSGLKMHNSISYLLEGKLWAVFNLFHFLYPATFRLNGLLNFKINKNTLGYTHLIDNLRQLIWKKIHISGSIPIITTKLWDHQLDSVNKITAGFIRGVHGFGNASDVGSGKTLDALAIACKMVEIGDCYHSGVLVLLPNNKLIETWRDQLTKHTKNFDVLFQENSSKINKIKRNTIVITTMARMRDHPIRHKWLLLIIDECLSVQNKNALQTEEAWMQSLLSKHLIMMSATFFRTRFDKLYYMLKMLQTGLPEKKEYLDTILVETMVSEVSIIKRKWISNVNSFTLTNKLQHEYNKLDAFEMDNEARFSKLSSYLISNKYIQEFVINKLNFLIKKMEKNNHKCLIYARSKNEAELWSKTLKIKQYPEKGKHCIVTYNDGTYGLNDLVVYSCIITRPPNADSIPQIKGRLDRPGQKLSTLHIEYFIIGSTIEEGLILRMNIASQFLHKYIMPLAKFYDISLNYKKYIENK